MNLSLSLERERERERVIFKNGTSRYTLGGVAQSASPLPLWTLLDAREAQMCSWRGAPRADAGETRPGGFAGVSHKPVLCRRVALGSPFFPETIVERQSAFTTFKKVLAILV